MSEHPRDFVTNLDTIEFEDLVLLARAEIPRFAGHWTDHNFHDPGMTLIDLLAWIVDQQIYRIGHVGGRHLRAFAALLGQQAERIQPARGLIWPAQRLGEGRLLELGTPVVCPARPSLPFLLERRLYLTSAPLLGAETNLEDGPIAAPVSDLNDVSWTLDDARHQRATALTLRFGGPLVTSRKEVPLSVGVEVDPPPGPAPGADDPPWGPVRYQYRIVPGADDEWTELRVEHDGTSGLGISGVVVLRVPPAPAGTVVSELRLSFDNGFFPVPPRLRTIGVNVLPVVQAEDLPAAPFTERGTGQPDQMVQLDSGDLTTSLARTHGKVRVSEVPLDVRVGGETWQAVEDLAESGPDDLHYVVATDHLLFGNGLNGRRPPLGAQIEHTGLTRTRGAEGNLRPGLSWRLPALDELVGNYGTNRHALASGRAATSATELVARARQAATHRQALLTDDDVARAARELPGMAVGRAEVIPRFDPRLPGHRVEGVRTLIVVPHGFAPTVGDAASDGEGASIGVAQAYLDEVAAGLAPRRVLGERLVVQGPSLVTVEIQIVITTEPWADSGRVTAAVETALSHRLAAVRDPAAADDVAPWPLGRDLSVSEVRSIAVGVDGVATVPSVRVAERGVPARGNENSQTSTAEANGQECSVVVPPDGVVVAGPQSIRIQVSTGGSPERDGSAARGWN
jgi:hypothetical protein